MPERARYDGAHESVHVIHPETNELLDTVKRGGLLSTDVPAAIRDELLSREDWTSVKDTNTAKKQEG